MYFAFLQCAQDAVDDWYAENVHYDYNTCESSDGETVGHFTQVVWMSSERVGCGVARSATNWIYYSCK